MEGNKTAYENVEAAVKALAESQDTSSPYLFLGGDKLENEDPKVGPTSTLKVVAATGTGIQLSWLLFLAAQDNEHIKRSILHASEIIVAKDEFDENAVTSSEEE